MTARRRDSETVRWRDSETARWRDSERVTTIATFFILMSVGLPVFSAHLCPHLVRTAGFLGTLADTDKYV